MIAAWAFGGWSDHHSAGIKHLLEIMSRHRSLVGINLLANITASIFEGTSTVLLFLAARQLVGESATIEGDPAGLATRAINSLERWLGWEGLFIAVVVLVVITQCLKSGFAFAALSAAARLRVLARRDAYLLILRQMVRLDFAQVAEQDTGGLYTHVSLAKYFDNLVETANSIAYTVVMTASYLCVLLWIAWDVTLLSVVVLIPVSMSLRKLILLTEQTARQLLSATIELNFRTLEFFNGMRLIRTFSREEESLRTLEDTIGKELDATRRGIVYQSSIRPVLEMVTVIMLAGILVAGFLLFGKEARATLPHLLIFLYALYRMVPRVTSLNSYWATIGRILPNVAHTMEFLGRQTRSRGTNKNLPFPGLRQAIELRNVSLRYDDNARTAIENVSLVIPRGSMIALVGESGAGKSSIVDLLIGLYRPTSGVILVDGVDLQELDIASLRRQIGVVSQNTFLLNASVRDNILFADPSSSTEKVIAAARRAHAHDFILNLDRGYDTTVGERGYRLSGGQCQRIAIARALLHDPEIIVFDEATSELDSESERIIQDALAELRSQKTLIVVAHRLSTVATADNIIVLDSGRVREIGTHLELLDRDGIYARLWNLQVGRRDV